MSDKPKDGVVRVDLEFSESAHARLEVLKEETGVETGGDVVHDALRLYDFLLTQYQEGHKIHLVKDGKAKELLLMEAFVNGIEALLDNIRSIDVATSTKGHVTVDISLENHHRLEQIQRETEQESLDETLEMLLDAFDEDDPMG